MLQHRARCIFYYSPSYTWRWWFWWRLWQSECWAKKHSTVLRVFQKESTSVRNSIEKDLRLINVLRGKHGSEKFIENGVWSFIFSPLGERCYRYLKKLLQKCINFWIFVAVMQAYRNKTLLFHKHSILYRAHVFMFKRTHLYYKA